MPLRNPCSSCISTANSQSPHQPIKRRTLHPYATKCTHTVIMPDASLLLCVASTLQGHVLHWGIQTRGSTHPMRWQMRNPHPNTHGMTCQLTSRLRAKWWPTITLPRLPNLGNRACVIRAWSPSGIWIVPSVRIHALAFGKAKSHAQARSLPLRLLKRLNS